MKLNIEKKKNSSFLRSVIVEELLNKRRFWRPISLAVSINSSGGNIELLNYKVFVYIYIGSLYFAKQIVEMLLKFTKEKEYVKYSE